MMLNEILATIPPKADRGNDKVAWSLTNNGAFSTKSAYHLISKNDTGPNHVVWKSIWKAKVPHRYKSFLWKILKGGLMTNSARLDRNFSTYDTCPMCQTKSESTIHVLRDCDTAKTLWNLLGVHQLDINFFNYNILDWIYRNISNPSEVVKGIPWPTVITATLSTLWYVRNDRVFNGKIATANQILFTIFSQATEFNEHLNVKVGV
ncbi:Reverse transcriptase zinc-binding domain [Sesbania bispinosa]|nr:Reverse transcriptase zinc-binding domain [Sesbania bispinosa]